MSLSTVNSLQLELHVDDFQKVKDFYGMLGFQTVWERTPEDKKGYLVLKNDADCILNFWCGNQLVYEQPYFGRYNRETKRGYGIEIVIQTVLSLPMLQERLSVEGVNIVEPLRKQPWGLEDFRCEDPFGYYLRITMPHDITDPANAVK